MKTTNLKTAAVVLVMFGYATQSFGQEKVLYKAELKKQEVPETVIESVEEDFPDFVLEEFYAIPLTYLEEDVIIDTPIDSSDDHETYQIVLHDKARSLKATYNKEGDLKYIEEHGKNVVPTPAVRNSIGKSFPGWVIKKDTYKMTHVSGKAQKEQYRVLLKKGKEHKRVYLDASGEILHVG